MNQRAARAVPDGDVPTNENFGFLHIGKTAGSSVRQLIRLSADHGYSPPTVFGHAARLPPILREYPRIKIGFVIRDPIERTISGFQSRLRQGRPTNQSLWSVEEATAFAFFADAASFLSALVSDADERLKSAALFAEKSIRHIARNYVFHLKDVEFLKRQRERIFFCRPIDEISNSVHELFEPCGIPREFVEQHYRPAHAGGGSTERILAALDGRTQTDLKRHFAAEYEIYNYLRDPG
ncbi:MAG: sulfotransferase family 2 domain-containing protein [Sedimenticolaceae bacterium]